MTNDNMSEQTTRTVIPAAPGWYVAMLIYGCKSDNQDDHFMLYPIVAWEIERYGQPNHTRWKQHVSREVIPLTAMGNLSQSTCLWAIKSPDGQFDVNGYMIGNEADAIQALKDEDPARDAVTLVTGDTR